MRARGTSDSICAGGFLRVFRTFRLLRTFRVVQFLREDSVFFRRNEDLLFAVTNLSAAQVTADSLALASTVQGYHRLFMLPSTGHCGGSTRCRPGAPAHGDRRQR